ncbi:hypothetical protein ABZ330_09555 [Streptomyces sp. NPDC006172]|uniref:hypothetical protein n=1 Tax=Streptomyces sp. NPDC006172 TaxID=3154470 RepID=UPI0033F246A1
MVRRPVAAVVTLVLFAEAFGVAALNWFLGVVVDRQHMSLAGLDPDVMSTSSKIGGLVFGLYFVLCGVVALLVLIRDRPPAGLGRILLISAAVVHGLLGAFSWGLVGRSAFAFMMVVLALIVLLLMGYDRQEGPPATEPAPTAPSDAGPPGGGAAGGDLSGVGPSGQAPSGVGSPPEAPAGPEGSGPAGPSGGVTALVTTAP